MSNHPISWAKWALSSAQLLLAPLPAVEVSETSSILTPWTTKQPVLGWNSWKLCPGGSSFDCVRENALIFNKTGLLDLGYKYMTLDDGWQAKPARGPDGKLVADPKRFGCNEDKTLCGIAYLASNLSAIGFELGIYSDSGQTTCGGNNGSLGHEEVDAATFASWGVSYLKYDNCCIPEELQDNPAFCGPKVHKIKPNPHCCNLTNNNPCSTDKNYDWKLSNSYHRYKNMSVALEKAGVVKLTNHPILFSMCIWGTADVTTWGRGVANSWRIWRDMLPQWKRFLEIVKAGANVIDTTDFYGHNDADLLQLGNGNFTDLNKARSHFALWAAMKSPLLINADMTKLCKEYPPIIDIIKNPYLHAFNQDDVFGKPAKPFNWDPKDKPPQYWSGPMSFPPKKTNAVNGTLILMLNTNPETEEMSVTWAKAGLKESKYEAVDIWGGEQYPCSKGPFKTSVSGNDTAGIFVTPC